MQLSPEQWNLLTTKEEHNQLKDKIDNIDKNIQLLLSAVDGLAVKFEKFDHELAANVGAHNRIDQSIFDHEKRISKLELKANVAA